ncbi:MAG: cation-translocating P-type ATPase [Patescibacteria group bacterium]
MLKSDQSMVKQLPWHALSASQVLKELKTSLKGLSEQSVLVRLVRVGHNILPERRQPGAVSIFLSQFKSALVIILLLAAVVTLALQEWLDGFVILIAVAINASVGFIQEYKAANALKELKNYVQDYARLKRDGKNVAVVAADLVPGDIIYLQPGDKVPADARLLEATELQVNEAALTGESDPVKKKIIKLATETVMAERINMVYQGSAVTLGRATAVVVATGYHTQLGKIAQLLLATKETDTPLQNKLSRLAKTIGLLVMFVCLGILVLGLSFSYDFQEMFTLAVAVAVSAVPEGLVVLVTAILALGMRRILQRQSLVRKLVAAETLGSTTVICADKTGTLTAGQMKVSQLVLANDLGQPEVQPVSENNLAKELLLSGIMASEAYREYKVQSQESFVVGSPTERALYLAAEEQDILIDNYRKDYPQIKVLPFNSDRKLMASLHKSDKEYRLYVKGAPERLLARCSQVAVAAGTIKMDEAGREAFMNLIVKMSGQGYRLLALTKKHLTVLAAKKFDLQEDNLKDLTLLGLAVLNDPLRIGVGDTLLKARQAGLRIIMITGDHKLTAQAVAGQAGLVAGPDNILNGDELNSLSEADLAIKLKQISVIARATPQDKLKIVKALQLQGEVVAMTGDGVNDAPALQAADIGIAFGTGTDVAREASDIVLLNDDISTIVAAVEEGRTIYNNIRKVLLYLMSDSFAEVVLIFGALLWSLWQGGGLWLPLLATQILWINLVADTFPALALANDPGRPEVMQEVPISRKKPILDLENKLIIGGISLLKGLGALLVFIFLTGYLSSTETIRTIVFSLMAVATPLYVFSLKQLDQPIWHKANWNNKSLLLAVLVSLFLQVLVVYWPPLQKVFYTTALTFNHWFMVLAFSVFLIIVLEAVKMIFYKRKKLSFQVA